MKASRDKFALLILLIAVTQILIIVPQLIFAGEKSYDGGASEKPLISEVGFVWGYGRGSVFEGSYQTMLIVLHLGIDAKNFFSSLKTHKGTLSFIVEPQYNPIKEPESNYEFGVGVGLQYSYPLAERISPYVLGVIGPHYINLSTETQARGFIFSNTLGIGSYFFLTKKAALNFGYRLRHMSNAYIKCPNRGIDSHFGVFGLSYYF